MNAIRVSSLLLLVLAVACVQAQVPTRVCTYKASSGAHYNLHPLFIRYVDSQTKYYTAKPTGAATYEVIFNVCGDVHNTGCEPGVASCKEDGGVSTNLGRTANMTLLDYMNPTTGHVEPNKGVLMNYKAGDVCILLSGQETNLYMECDHHSQWEVLSVDETSECHTRIMAKSKHACRTGGHGMDGGWVFIILLVVAAAVYLIAGAIVKKVHFHAEGIDLIPNIHFWQSLPSLVVDGMRFFAALATCRAVASSGAHPSGPYERVEHQAEAPALEAEHQDTPLNPQSQQGFGDTHDPSYQSV